MDKKIIKYGYNEFKKSHYRENIYTYGVEYITQSLFERLTQDLKAHVKGSGVFTPAGEIPERYFLSNIKACK